MKIILTFVVLNSLALFGAYVLETPSTPTPVRVESREEVRAREIRQFRNELNDSLRKFAAEGVVVSQVTQESR